MIDLEAGHIGEVRRILAEHVPGIEVWAFGSRVTGKAGKFSDLDLVLVGPEPIDWRRMEALRDAFSESGLPIQVDVVDWHAVSESFRRVIKKNYEAL